MIHVIECKGPTPPPPRKPPVPTDAGASGADVAAGMRRRSGGFLSTILTNNGNGNSGLKSLLGL